MATSSEPEMGTDPESVPTGGKDLRLFEGTLIPGMYFSSGYCLWAFDFTSVPTGVDPFRDVWVFTPDGERILYIDSKDASEIISRNHAFDRVVVGEITIEQTRGDAARVTVKHDELNLVLDLSFTQTGGTRILNAMAAVTPTVVSRTKFGTALSTRLLNSLVEANGTKVAGRFGTGEPYRFEAEHMAVITDATATLNGTDLGVLTRPEQPVADGDVKNMPLYIHGRAYVPIWK